MNHRSLDKVWARLKKHATAIASPPSNNTNFLLYCHAIATFAAAFGSGAPSYVPMDKASLLDAVDEYAPPGEKSTPQNLESFLDRGLGKWQMVFFVLQTNYNLYGTFSRLGDHARHTALGFADLKARKQETGGQCNSRAKFLLSALIHRVEKSDPRRPSTAK
jgi:hypothetical protein